MSLLSKHLCDGARPFAWDGEILRDFSMNEESWSSCCDPAELGEFLFPRNDVIDDKISADGLLKLQCFANACNEFCDCPDKDTYRMNMTADVWLNCSDVADCSCSKKAVA